jgi:hypothetical protein
MARLFIAAILATLAAGASLMAASGPGPGPLYSDNNLSELASPSTALANLGMTASTTELGYVDGVTSPIQTQLDAKLAKAGGTMTGALALNSTMSLRETGASPTFYSVFQGGDQSGAITYTLPVNDGDASQVLTTNGTGVLSWAAVASGGDLQDAYDNGPTIQTLDPDPVTIVGDTASSVIPALVVTHAGNGAPALETRQSNGGTSAYIWSSANNSKPILHVVNDTGGASPDIAVLDNQQGSFTGRHIVLRGQSNTDLGIKVPTSITPHDLTLPGAQGAAGTSLQNDGSGLLSWTATGLQSVVDVDNEIDDGIGQNFLTIFSTSPTATLYLNTFAVGDILNLRDDSGGGARHLVLASGSDEVGISVLPGVTPYNMTLPIAQGAANSALVNDGSGALSWSGARSVCTVSAVTPTTTAANFTCTGVPASTAVAVNCSANAAFSTPTGSALYCRATGTVNQIACNTAVANITSVDLTCWYAQ